MQLRQKDLAMKDVHFSAITTEDISRSNMSTRTSLLRDNLTNSTLGHRDEKQINERILHYTMQIVSLLTGEHYTLVKKHPDKDIFINNHSVPQDFIRTPRSIIDCPSISFRHDGDTEKKVMTEKILELTNKIIRLLTGEACIRCEDIAVYFSMAEWEYLKERKEMYKDVEMEGNQACSLINLSASKDVRHESLNGLNTHNQKLEDCQALLNCQKIANEITSKSIKQESDQEISVTPLNLCVADSIADTAEDLSVVKLECSEKEIDLLTIQTENNNLSKSGIELNNDSRDHNYQRSELDVKLHICNDCGKTFPKFSRLITHRRSHTGEKPYTCAECGKRFGHLSGLSIHRRWHAGERPHACNQCGKSYILHSQLVVHQRGHSGEKPFSCTECGKSFSVKSYLITHQRTHTGEKPYCCPECGKCFIRKSHLVVHQKTHSGDQKFSYL